MLGTGTDRGCAPLSSLAGGHRSAALIATPRGPRRFTLGLAPMRKGTRIH
jgi:hypothetical protein